MNKTFLANVIIHSFATAHAIAAAALAQTLVGDEATLTALTIAMIIALSKLYQAPLSWGGALSFFGCFCRILFRNTRSDMLDKMGSWNWEYC
mgnify:CR=1 FL=1